MPAAGRITCKKAWNIRGVEARSMREQQPNMGCFPRFRPMTALPGGIFAVMAEAVRFELTKGCPLPVFKTGAIDHSATLPVSCRPAWGDLGAGAIYPCAAEGPNYILTATSGILWAENMGCDPIKQEE